ncbi:alanine/glycine:cation symporter family protein [Helicobacter cappadocius]|uniref:Amino acid carrier protein n=1 Tax=Helicobacter cappadocius TaxID=3063998 RepID=A0AA90PVC0_9HELI|nr:MULTISPECIES: amino acid carrier protein [unclassified Helicobacter]MDO7253171.1 amino acid carrier protein [Helicobacter sp. faydin-H75]MDP2539095.1 amino acid carrier protein [Helicobacter sp. faydin-H76]
MDTETQSSGLMDMISAFISHADNFIWGYYLVALLLLVGIFYSIRLKFPQVTLTKAAFHLITERDANAKGNKEHISPYEALMISMGTRVGMGTIVGMAVAVVSGGPGAIVWIWIAAWLNGAIAIAENTLGQIYKSKDGGAFKGGPAYYLTKGLNAKKVAILYSCITIAIGWAFIGLYSQTIYSSFEGYAAVKEIPNMSVYVGLVLAIFSGIMFFGGGRYIAKFTSYVTPFMASVFLIIALISIGMHYHKALDVIHEIFRSAFDFKAIFGGFAGSVIVIGIQRGLFANEAGLGSVPGASSSAHTTHPVKQGIVQAFCVFIDTVIATLAVLFILFSDAYGTIDPDTGDKLTAMPLVQAAMQESFGIWGNYYVTFLIVVLTSTVIIGAYYIGQMNMKYIKDNPTIVAIYRIITIIVVYLGAQASLGLAWGVANVVMGIGATINIITIFLLAKVAKTALNDYVKQRKQGLDPTFSAKKLGIKNAECWD